MEIVAYIDGGARGNPGPAGYGVRVEDNAGTLLEEMYEPIGLATNNVAEYRGLLAALAYAGARGCRVVHIRSDSLLLVKQMRGEYRVKHPGLKALHREARDLVAHFDRVSFEHVPRERNAEADRLANLAMDMVEGGQAPDAERKAAAPVARGRGTERPKPGKLF
jgi:probable phosphoglycerate mutase